MTTQIARRDFIRSGLGALAGSGLISNRGDAVNQPAAAPVRTPRLLLGLCAYSYRVPLTAGAMNMEDFVLKGVELGVSAVDVTTYWFKGGMDPVYLRKFRDFAFKNGMPFSGAACGPDLLQASDAEREEAYEKTKRWIDGTEALGAPHLRIFAGPLAPGMTQAQGINFVVEAMKSLCDYSGSKGIALGVEIHHGITQKADVALEIIHRVNNPYAGITLDITHFEGDNDEDLYRQIESCIPYATQTHIRPNFDEGHGVIDFDRVWKMFAKAGYRGYMSLEYDPGKGGEDAATGVPKVLAQMKALCKKYSDPSV
jgi:sugar phosphate isomerase/epimerase